MHNAASTGRPAVPSPPHTDDPGRIAAALVVAVIDGDRHGAELLLRDCGPQTCAQVAVSLAIMLIAVADAPPERIRARMTEILEQHPPLLWAAVPCASTGYDGHHYSRVTILREPIHTAAGRSWYPPGASGGSGPREPGDAAMPSRVTSWRPCMSPGCPGAAASSLVPGSRACPQERASRLLGSPAGRPIRRLGGPHQLGGKHGAGRVQPRVAPPPRAMSAPGCPSVQR